MAWLLDTNILSELRRLKPEPKVLAFVAAHPLDELYISAVTLAELRFGIELLSEGSTRRDELNKWLTNTIRPMFDKRVLPITEDIMLRWRLVVEEGRKAGYAYSQPDLIIAATALHYGFTMVVEPKKQEVKVHRRGEPLISASLRLQSVLQWNGKSVPLSAIFQLS